METVRCTVKNPKKSPDQRLHEIECTGAVLYPDRMSAIGPFIQRTGVAQNQFDESERLFWAISFIESRFNHFICIICFSKVSTNIYESLSGKLSGLWR